MADATPEQVVEMFVEMAVEDARRSARAKVQEVVEGVERPYYQWTMTYEEADEASKKHGGASLIDRTGMEDWVG